MDSMLTEEEASLYDRQIRLWGADAQRRLRESKILLIGMKGLNAEVCKNLVLAGVNAVTILDHERVSETDLGAHIFFEDSDVGKNRATASIRNISILNPLVKITSDESDVTKKPDSFFENFNVVSATNCNLETLIRIDSICRKNGIYFFGADTFGTMGYFFEDLTVYKYLKKPAEDPNESKEHHDAQPKLGEPVVVQFSSLQDALNTKWDKLKRVPKTFFGMQILHEFRKTHHRLPNHDDFSSLKQIAQLMLAHHNLNKDFLDDTFLQTLASSGQAEVSPVCAVIGGVLAQEIITVISGKDQPLNNLFLYDAFDVVRPGNVIQLPQ